MDNSWV